MDAAHNYWKSRGRCLVNGLMGVCLIIMCEYSDLTIPFLMEGEGHGIL